MQQPATLRSGRPAEAPTVPKDLRAARLDQAVTRAQDNLFRLQRDDGHWCGELEGDSILESEYVLLLTFLGRGDDPRAAKAAEQLRRQQMEDGGWSLYPGGPADASSSVKAYFVLKLQGDTPDAPHMARARERILELGGLAATNTYTKTYLAIFGQVPWSHCPVIPPEILLLPRWFWFDVYEMSSWSRAIFVPLSVIWAVKPRVAVPSAADLGELWRTGPADFTSLPESAAGASRERLWRTFFHSVDRGLKLWEASGMRPLRRRALDRAHDWIVERLEKSDGLGAIFPGIVNTVMALRCLGYEVDDPLVRQQVEQLHALEIDEGDALRVQPCFSPVWDTAQAVSALAASGVPAEDPRLQRAARWLLDKEVETCGDWIHRTPEGTPVSGWYFEYANEFYPDCDDTAEVLTALGRVRFTEPDDAVGQAAARRRALQWLLGMQNEDGGWGAFDRGCDKDLLTLVPFADHNAMLDPSCEDITGRVLETLAEEGYARSHPVVVRAVGFLQRSQLEDGTWYGRWGSNYIYGTWLALWGLAVAGEDMTAEVYQRSARWLRRHQNPDGGWGESLASYEDPAHKGHGPSTAAQTAWALLGLFATGDFTSAAVRRGVDHLLDTQLEDGSWSDEHWTATGFPRVFYLRYDYYDDYFPLLALAIHRHGPSVVRERSRLVPRPVA